MLILNHMEELFLRYGLLENFMTENRYRIAMISTICNAKMNHFLIVLYVFCLHSFCTIRALGEYKENFDIFLLYTIETMIHECTLHFK